MQNTIFGDNVSIEKKKWIVCGIEGVLWKMFPKLRFTKTKQKRVIENTSYDLILQR